jgi:hypothetical protein
MAEKSERLNPDQCREKAAECRQLAKEAPDKSHKIMLESIAETWERIAADTKWQQ